MEGKDMIRKLEYYKDENKTVHVRVNSRRFYNGKIFILDLKRNLMVLMDNKIGEVPILFEEILGVEPFREVRG